MILGQHSQPVGFDAVCDSDMVGHQPIAFPAVVQRFKASDSRLGFLPPPGFKLIFFRKPGEKRRSAPDILTVPWPGLGGGFFRQRNPGHLQ